MYQTPKDLGLTQQEIDRIAEELWLAQTPRPTCPDCGVEVNQQHKASCDIAQCSKCGFQRLSCDCHGGHGGEWTGIFPGVKECYEQKFICTYGDGKWMFDLNSYYENKK